MCIRLRKFRIIFPSQFLSRNLWGSARTTGRKLLRSWWATGPSRATPASAATTVPLPWRRSLRTNKEREKNEENIVIVQGGPMWLVDLLGFYMSTRSPENLCDLPVYLSCRSNDSVDEILRTLSPMEMVKVKWMWWLTTTNRQTDSVKHINGCHAQRDQLTGTG